MIDNRTTNLNFPLPNSANTLNDDVLRIIAALQSIDTALQSIDTALQSIDTAVALKAPLANPTFTGTVSGVTAAMVGLGNVNNTSNATERAATATLTNKTLTAPVINNPTGSGFVASINGATGVVLLPTTQSLTYANRANLRSKSPAAGEQAIVDGLGLFVWQSASTEPDDDESCFATASGCWLLEAAHWDLVDAWQAPEWQALTDDDEDEPLRFASKVLTTTWTNAVISVTANTRTTAEITVTGAAIGDAVLITRSGTYTTSSEGLAYGVVTASNTITVYLCGGDYTTTFFLAGTWRVTVFKS